MLLYQHTNAIKLYTFDDYPLFRSERTALLMKLVNTALRLVAAVRLAVDADDNSTGLVSSLQRGEGYAAIPGLIADAFGGDGDGDRDVVQPFGLSNIPAAEAQINNPDFGKPTTASQRAASDWRQDFTDEEIYQPVTQPPVSPRANPRVTPKVTARQSLAIQQPQPQVPPSPAKDPRNQAYIQAHNQLTSNSTDAERKAVQQIGMETWEDIYGKQ